MEQTTSPIASERGTHSPTAYDTMKRLVDVVISSIVLALLIPLFVFIAFVIKLDSRGPVFFRQRRIGRGHREFFIIKFRTMVQHAEALGPQVTASDDPRVTRLGRLLRAWKLDELPQFFNVLLGDMSIVGPRPQVPRYVQHFPLDQRKTILSVRPGITGPTAIKFRHEEEILENRLDREEFYIRVLVPIKCDLDETYVRSRSFLLDAQVVLLTALMLGRGVWNRLCRRPLGLNIEYPIPEISLACIEQDEDLILR